MIENIHILSTVYMTGLIWFVQLVHYPMFAQVGPEHFETYEKIHNQRTSIAVMPAMLAELGTAVWLFVQTPELIYGVGLGLIGIIWASTFLLQVPCHTRLLTGFDPATQRKLVNTNWIRTIAWSARALLFTLLA